MILNTINYTHVNLTYKCFTAKREKKKTNFFNKINKVMWQFYGQITHLPQVLGTQPILSINNWSKNSTSIMTRLLKWCLRPLRSWGQLDMSLFLKYLHLCLFFWKTFNYNFVKPENIIDWNVFTKQTMQSRNFSHQAKVVEEKLIFTNINLT